MYIPWGGTRTLLYLCTVVPWLLLFYFCIPSLPWLATAWICPLALREGLRGEWSLFPANKKQGMWKGFVTGRAPQCPAQFQSHDYYCRLWGLIDKNGVSSLKGILEKRILWNHNVILHIWIKSSDIHSWAENVNALGGQCDHLGRFLLSILSLLSIIYLSILLSPNLLTEYLLDLS